MTGKDHEWKNLSEEELSNQATLDTLLRRFHGDVDSYERMKLAESIVRDYLPLLEERTRRLDTEIDRIKAENEKLKTLNKNMDAELIEAHDAYHKMVSIAFDSRIKGITKVARKLGSDEGGSE